MLPSHPEFMQALAVLCVSFAGGVGWSLGCWLVHKVLK